MLIAQFNYFIWPFFVLCLLNMLIMVNIWRRTRKMTRLMFPAGPHGKARTTNGMGSSLADREETLAEQRLSVFSTKRVASREEHPSIIVEENENDNPSLAAQSSSSLSTAAHVVLPPVQLGSVARDVSSLIRQRSSSKSSARHSNESRRQAHRHRDTCSSLVVARRSPPVRVRDRHDLDPSFVSNEHRCVESELISQTNASRSLISDGIRRSNRCEQSRQRHSRIVRDQRAARSLFILVLVFLIFLLPYVICATASTAGLYISPLLFEIAFGLLWLNSTCNPFLYPFIQMKYRRAYCKLFQWCYQLWTSARHSHTSRDAPQFR